MAFFPVVAISTIGLDIASTGSTAANNVIELRGLKQDINNNSSSEDKISEEEAIRKEKAAKIDSYFESKSLPLAGHGEQFVAVAEKYNLPYNLLPAIAMRESTGGKFAYRNNPFGWGSAKIRFSDFNEAIEVVGKNLGGENPRTASYYGGKTTKQKLYAYNGTVVAGYENEVMKIMSTIDNVKVDDNKKIELADL